jgi:hypothetical protein
VIFENGIGVTVDPRGGTVPYSEGFGVEVRWATTEELEERVGTQVGVRAGNIPDENFCIGFPAKIKRINRIPNNINPPIRNRQDFILSSNHEYP